MIAQLFVAIGYIFILMIAATLVILTVLVCVWMIRCVYEECWKDE